MRGAQAAAQRCAPHLENGGAVCRQDAARLADDVHGGLDGVQLHGDAARRLDQVLQQRQAPLNAGVTGARCSGASTARCRRSRGGGGDGLQRVGIATLQELVVGLGVVGVAAALCVEGVWQAWPRGVAKCVTAACLTCLIL